MIPFDFAYYKPSTITEAVQTVESLYEDGKKSLFLSGGTEFITDARLNKIRTDAVIDIKGVPGCNVLDFEGDKLVIGASVPLNRISESALFPLLGDTLKKIADHTSRNKITIGGNLCSRLMYREGVLPLLLSDATVKIAGLNGEEVLPLTDVFQGQMNISSGNFLIQIIIDKSYLNLPYYTFKRTKASKIGYPLISLSALKKDDWIRLAFSGVCNYPFRSMELENVINDRNLTLEETIIESIKQLPSAVVDDMNGSAKYREFVLKNSLEQVLEKMKEEIA